eukprot:8252676-Lingulodinium_polyedra.AAC.1
MARRTGPKTALASPRPRGARGHQRGLPRAEHHRRGRAKNTNPSNPRAAPLRPEGRRQNQM